MGQSGSQLLAEIERSSNCAPNARPPSSAVTGKLTRAGGVVSHEEIQRLKKRFMKLDRDQSGSIDREEFLQVRLSGRALGRACRPVARYPPSPPTPSRLG